MLDRYNRYNFINTWNFLAVWLYVFITPEKLWGLLKLNFIRADKIKMADYFQNILTLCCVLYFSSVHGPPRACKRQGE